MNNYNNKNNNKNKWINYLELILKDESVTR